ncbi:unnamed protein product [Rhodiola kirilowii]
MDTIKAIILDMFAGRTDTTSSVLEWAMTELLRHPKVMKTLQEEVRKFQKQDFLKEEDLVTMLYLKAVIKETMRLHPPIPLMVPRESRQAVKLMGYDIAAGMRVFVNAWAIGRDPGSWEEAEEFRPERFIENDNEEGMGQGYKFIQFGADRRGCPGIGFAMPVEEIALANLVCKFDWKLPGEGRTEDLDMFETNGLTIHRKYPLIALASPYDHLAM